MQAARGICDPPVSNPIRALDLYESSTAAASMRAARAASPFARPGRRRRAGPFTSLRSALAGRCRRGGIILFDLIRRSCLLMAPFHPAGGFFLLLFPPRPGFLPFLECFHFSSDQRPALGTREKDTSFRFFSSYRLNRRAPRLAPSVICLAA